MTGMREGYILSPVLKLLIALVIIIIIIMSHAPTGA